MRRHIVLPGFFAILFAVLLTGDSSSSRTAAQDKPEKKDDGKVEKAVGPPLSPAELLYEIVHMKDFQQPMSLGEALKELEKKLAERGHQLPILVDTDAFKEGLEGADIYDTQVKFPPFPRKLTVCQFLKLAIAKISSGEATLLLRPEVIEITTVKQAAPAMRTVSVKFKKALLPEALAELSRQTGIGIVLDGRAVNEIGTFVTATFPPETNLVTATALLANMAGLKVRVVDRLLYVTSRTNHAPLPVPEVKKQVEKEPH